VYFAQRLAGGPDVGSTALSEAAEP
jgi:hypothetical protein